MEINPKKSNTLTIVYYTNLKHIRSTNNPKKKRKIKNKKTNKPPFPSWKLPIQSIINSLSFEPKFQEVWINITSPAANGYV